MATSEASVLDRSDLNAFLFAAIGTEASGMTLSVLSVLARQGSDPWREASRLAHLPKAEASDSLAHTIADMPRSMWNLTDAMVIAARLIALLPARPGRGEKRSLPLTGRALPSIRTIAICVAIALGVGYFAWVSMRSDPPQYDGSDVPSFTSSPTAPSLNLGEGRVATPSPQQEIIK